MAKLAGVDINRKMLAELAVHDAEAFAKPATCQGKLNLIRQNKNSLQTKIAKVLVLLMFNQGECL